MKEKQFDFTVVIPVYRVEHYLRETLDSVISQTIGFEEHIQIILVNDGSPDNSEAICLEYRDAYPDNIEYLKKENGGVSSARNAAIPYIRGDYVNFLDSDDCWEADAFAAVKTLIEHGGDRADVIGCRKRFFGAKDGYHYLDYKFEYTRVVDLRQHYDYIQLDVTAAFIRTEAIGGLRFSELLQFGEDARFVNSILLKSCCLGVCREAVHRYRKRLDQSSALQNDVRNKSYYINSPRYFLQALLDQSVAAYGRKERFIQYTVMYELGWRIRKEGIRQYLTEEEYEAYCDQLTALLRQIDRRIILKQRVLWKKHKLFCLLKRSGMNRAARWFCRITRLKTVYG